MKKFGGYGVGPSYANARSRDYKLYLISVARNENCPGVNELL